jgi:hypothetical protein
LVLTALCHYVFALESAILKLAEKPLIDSGINGLNLNNPHDRSLLILAQLPNGICHMAIALFLGERAISPNPKRLPVRPFNFSIGGNRWLKVESLLTSSGAKVANCVAMRARQMS